MTRKPPMKSPDLSAAALVVRGMIPHAIRHDQPVVIVADRESAQLRAQLAAALAENEKLKHAAAERAQREERVKAITLRVVDNRAAWMAKQPKARTPHVTLNSTHVITADVWESSTGEDA